MLFSELRRPRLLARVDDEKDGARRRVRAVGREKALPLPFRGVIFIHAHQPLLVEKGQRRKRAHERGGIAPDGVALAARVVEHGILQPARRADALHGMIAEVCLLPFDEIDGRNALL